MKIKCTFHIAIAFILIQLTDEFSIAFAYGICEKNPYVRILYVTFADFEPADHDIFIYEVYYKNSNAGFVFRNAASEKKVVYNSGINAGINMPFLYIFYKGNT